MKDGAQKAQKRDGLAQKMSQSENCKQSQPVMG
jgi:hypothetical protein